VSDKGQRTRSEAPRLRRESPDRPGTWLFHVLSCETPARPTAPARRLDDIAQLSLGRGEPCATGAPGDPSRARLEVADPWMSTRHARIERSFGGFWVIDEGSKNGVAVNGDRTERTLLADGDWIEAGHTIFRFRHGTMPAIRAREPRPDAGAVLRTSLPTLDRQARDLEEVARSKLPVILRGETGTGKEVVARAVHGISGRPGELVAVNCGALPATLLESELFGHRRGAFSGAVEDHPGLVRAADRGTLFLDEVADLPLASQAALLRVLQEREVTPVGGTRPIKVDLRTICATHKDLGALVALGQFRSDLYARLSGHTFALPPLRERREDLGLLVAALLDRIAPDREIRFELDAARALYRHDWPLNVRELEKCLGAAVVLARGAPIAREHLAIAGSSEPPAPATPTRPDRRELLVSALREHRGNVSAVARSLGKARSLVQRWLRDHRLDPAHYRDH
jgi:DNA-binding NtrC family response regulator